MLTLTQDLKEKSATPRPSSVCFLRSGIAIALAAPEICLPKICIGRVAFREAMFQDLDNIIQAAENTVVSVKGIDVADSRLLLIVRKFGNIGKEKSFRQTAISCHSSGGRSNRTLIVKSHNQQQCKNHPFYRF
jgi:hypothetical protein